MTPNKPNGTNTLAFPPAPAVGRESNTALPEAKRAFNPRATTTGKKGRVNADVMQYSQCALSLPVKLAEWLMYNILNHYLMIGRSSGSDEDIESLRQSLFQVISIHALGNRLNFDIFIWRKSLQTKTEKIHTP